MAALSPAAGAAVFAGLTSHYPLDLQSEMGIPLFYPFIRRRIALGWFKNGGREEFISRVILAGLSAIAMMKWVT
jgi:membrane-bound metal-dependent hydrolase YbcI (DUF457 family)